MRPKRKRLLEVWEGLLRGCVRACVRACARACARVRACVCGERISWLLRPGRPHGSLPQGQNGFLAHFALNRLVLQTQSPGLGEAAPAGTKMASTRLALVLGRPVPTEGGSPPPQSWPLLAALETSQRMTAEQRHGLTGFWVPRSRPHVLCLYPVLRKNSCPVILVFY